MVQNHNTQEERNPNGKLNPELVHILLKTTFNFLSSLNVKLTLIENNIFFAFEFPFLSKNKHSKCEILGLIVFIIFHMPYLYIGLLCFDKCN